MRRRKPDWMKTKPKYKPMSMRKKKYRRKFTGVRDDTEPTDPRIAGGEEYIRRYNAPIFPKLTTLPLSPSTRKLYAFLRRYHKAPNYDELLVFLVNALLKLEYYRREDVQDILKKLLKRADKDIRLRRIARHRAMRKMRYRPR